MRRYSLSSLRVRFLLLVILALLPAFGLFGFIAWQHRRLATAEIQQDTLALARLISFEHARVIEGAHQLLAALVTHPAVAGGDPGACSRLLADIRQRHPRYVNLGAARVSGEVFCSALPVPWTVTAADRTYFQRALATRDFAVGEYQIGRISGRPTVVFAHPALDEAGGVRAVAFAALDLAWLNELRDEVALPGAAQVLVIDHSGVILARIPDPEQWVGKAVPEAQLTRTVLSRREGVAELPDLDGIPRVWGFVPLRGASEASPIHVAVGISRAAAYGTSESLLLWSLAGLGIAGALAMLAAWAGADVVIVRRLHALIGAAERLRTGDLHARTGMARGSGEIHYLARAFDQMAEALEQRTAEREDTAEKLRASNETLQAVIEGSPLAIYALDQAGIVRMWNPAAERMFGWSAQEVLGQPHPTVPEGEEEDLRLTLMRHFQGETLIGREVRRRRKDGALIDVALSTAPLRDPSGQITAVLTLAADITERKTLEEQFRRAQKLEAVGQLAGGIAHDFNNLLTVIIGRSQLLLARGPVEDRIHRDVDLILKTATRAVSLTKQVLAFSRKQVLQPKVLQLNGVVSGIMPMLERLIGEHIEALFRPASTLGLVRADPGQLEQVIVNLVVNARDAMPEGGRLTLETANADLDEEYARRHMGAQPGAYVMLAVTDTGVGMDAATQARIFEPFFTTKEPGKGTGLGLATVYGIVKQSGGSIWVYSEVGRGTTVKAYLPRVDQETGETTEMAPPAADRGTETILLAEDDEEVRTLARDALQIYGYTILEARRPADALLIAERHAGPIQLLLTDVIMPQMSGPKLVERVRPLRPEMRVLYMSGYTGNTAPLGGGEGAGANAGFLPKPFTPEGLARKVREVLDAPE